MPDFLLQIATRHSLLLPASVPNAGHHHQKGQRQPEAQGQLSCD
jgi:hypothetical protein